MRKERSCREVYKDLPWILEDEIIDLVCHCVSCLQARTVQPRPFPWRRQQHALRPPSASPRAPRVRPFPSPSLCAPGPWPSAWTAFVSPAPAARAPPSPPVRQPCHTTVRDLKLPRSRAQVPPELVLRSADCLHKQQRLPIATKTNQPFLFRARTAFSALHMYCSHTLAPLTCRHYQARLQKHLHMMLPTCQTTRQTAWPCKV